jgi:hypothetical protein
MIREVLAIKRELINAHLRRSPTQWIIGSNAAGRERAILPSKTFVARLGNANSCRGRTVLPQNGLVRVKAQRAPRTPRAKIKEELLDVLGAK